MPTPTPLRLGVIADTHGLLRPEALAAWTEAAWIVGNPSSLHRPGQRQRRNQHTDHWNRNGIGQRRDQWQLPEHCQQNGHRTKRGRILGQNPGLPFRASGHTIAAHPQQHADSQER